MDLFWNSSTPLTNVLLNSSDKAVESLNFTMRSTITLVIAGCLSFIGTVGNILFIMCFWLEEKLRTVSNYLITMLALADTMVCLGCILVYILMVNRLTSVYSCWYWLSTIPLCPIISMYCQFLISIDRTVLITQSIATYKKWFNTKLCTIYALGGWIFHVIYIILLITIVRPPEIPGEFRCMVMDALQPTRERLIYTLNGFSIIYFGMSCVCYGRLVYYVRQKRVPLTSTKQAYVRISKMLLVLCVFSVTSTLLLPIFVYISFSFTNNQSVCDVLDQVGAITFFLGFAINPFFYGFRIKTFRYKLKSLYMFYLIRRVVPVTDIE